MEAGACNSRHWPLEKCLTAAAPARLRGANRVEQRSDRGDQWVLVGGFMLWYLQRRQHSPEWPVCKRRFENRSNDVGDVLLVSVTT